MTLSREEAAAALGEIEAAKGKAARLRGYRYGAPFAMLWGALWIVANVTSYFAPHLTGWAWNIGVPAVFVASALVGIRQGGDRSRLSAEDRGKMRRVGLKVLATNLIGMFGLFSFFVLMWPYDAREYNATISLMGMVAYMVLGVWIGWRLFAIGAVAAAVILFAYFRVGDTFPLWMGLAAGGALFLGGLWLRKA
jgi:MFS family permease